MDATTERDIVSATAPSSSRADWRSPALGPARILDLPGGRGRAHVTGEGPAIVFVHGALVNANLWRKVVPRLDGFTRVVLDLPLGSHLDPLPPHADMSGPGIATLVADAIEALGLEEVTVVGNDTGGAITQILAVRRPERVASIVLTSCDAFENFPPRFFRVVFAPARIPGAIPVVFGALRLRPLRRLPIAYGWLSGPIEREAEDSYVLPVLGQRAVRRDLRKLLRSIHPSQTLDAAARLTGFRKPALIAWSENDRFFPVEHGRRLATLIPDGRFELVEGARTFSPEDRPERLAELIGAFVRQPAPALR
jgi:pimeloyl-ACP methyl ester carboxylesterase